MTEIGLPIQNPAYRTAIFFGCKKGNKKELIFFKLVLALEAQ